MNTYVLGMTIKEAIAVILDWDLQGCKPICNTKNGTLLRGISDSNIILLHPYSSYSNEVIRCLQVIRHQPGNKVQTLEELTRPYG